MGNGVPGLGAKALVRPCLDFLARWDNRLYATLGDCLVKSLRVIRAVAADACHAFALVDLVEQAWQHRRVADGIVSHPDGANFQRCRLNAQVNPTPLTTVVGTMLFGFSLAFAAHLDASAVGKQLQACRCWVCTDRHCQILLAPAGSAEVRHLPFQAGQLEQALRHAPRLPSRQVEQPLNGHAELNCMLTLLPATAPLAAGTAVPAHVLVQPDQQRATRL